MKVRIEVLEDDGYELELHAVGSHPTFGWQPLKEPRPMKAQKGNVFELTVAPGTSIIGVRGAPKAEPEKARPVQPPEPVGTPYRPEKILDGGGRRE